MIIEIYVKTDRRNRTDCIYHHFQWQDIPTALNELQTAGFQKVNTAREPPEVMVTIQVPFGGFVSEGGGTPSPQLHPERYCLPGADLEKTKAALEDLGARQAGGVT